jgi:hypothetical protein
MLILNPRSVTFGPSRWDNILSISVDRTPQRIIEDWSDAGPYVVFADIPEQKLRITVTQELSATDLAAPTPGDRATLSLLTSPAATDQRRQRLTTSAVVLQTKHDLSQKNAPTRTILLAPISPDGETDPITITDA